MKRILIYLAVLFAVVVLPISAIAQSLTWHTDQLVASTDQDAFNSRVAISGSNAVAVWSRFAGTQNGIFASRSANSGATWSVPVQINFSARNAANPQVAISGSNVVAVWEEDDGSRNRIYANHSSDGGATWQGAQVIEPVSLSNGREPQVAVSGNYVVVVWTLDSGLSADIYTNHATFSGSTLPWVPASATWIETSSEAARFSHLAMSGSNVVAVWSQGDGSHDRIYANYSTNAGVTWVGDTLIENTSTLDGNYPRIAMSGNNVVAVWMAYDSLADLSRIYANCATFSGTVLTWTPSNTARLDNIYPFDGSAPQIAISGSNVVAVWNGNDGGTSRVYKAYSTNAGTSWSVDTLLQTDNTVNAGNSQVAISGSNVVAIWSQALGGVYRFYARHSFNSGSSWSAPVLIEDNSGFNGTTSHIAISGNNAVVAWSQIDTYGFFSIYANYATFSSATIIGGAGGGGGGGGCFIATTAFGTPLAGQVDILRKFRDRYLLTNDLGRQFVAWYYENGPVAASFIQDKPMAKAAVRAALYPLIGFSFLLINGFMSSVVIGLLLAGVLYFRFRFKKLVAR